MAARIMAFCGSLRRDSLNKRLLDQVVQLINFYGGEVDLVDLNDYALPFYNQEIQEIAFPENADKLKTIVEQNHGILIVTPEYNFSFPALVKNVIDWLSRYEPVNPLMGKQGMLMSASPSLTAGNRGLWQLRQPLECVGVHVHPNMFSLAQAHQAFKDDGTLKDEALQRRLEDAVIAYIHLINKVRR